MKSMIYLKFLDLIIIKNNAGGEKKRKEKKDVKKQKHGKETNWKSLENHLIGTATREMLKLYLVI